MQNHKQSKSIHHFAMECEEWARLFANKDELANQGCNTEEIKILSHLSKVLGNLAFACGDLDRSELAGMVESLNQQVDTIPEHASSLYVKRACRTLKEFLSEFPR
ncbi:MAG: hypothetical protein SFT92_07840 [Rickettsiales bacterium]|nr:hypothetical protein [Rickettsiales bacterium]